MNAHKFTTLEGSVLPLALIMTFLMLLAGIGIGTVILDGSQRARDIDQSVHAYYTADSGIERQLFEIRKRDQTLAGIENLASAYPNAGKWVSTASLEQTWQKKIVSIAENDFAVIDFFDPDNLGSPSNIDQVDFNWTGDAQMEISYAQWPAGETVIWPNEDAYVATIANSPGASILNLDRSSAYRFRLKVLNGSATNVYVNPYLNGAPQPFPGDITMGAEGTYGKATQKIVVTMPKQDVLSGLYSYVLFSECQLIKGIEGLPVCP